MGLRSPAGLLVAKNRIRRSRLGALRADGLIHLREQARASQQLPRTQVNGARGLTRISDLSERFVRVSRFDGISVAK